MKKFKVFLTAALLVAMLLVSASCIPGDERYTAEYPAGLFWGFWHGMVAWISFIIGILTNGQFTVYEANNTGWPYNLGFLIGMGSSIGGIGRGVFKVTLDRRKHKTVNINIGRKSNDNDSDVIDAGTGNEN